MTEGICVPCPVCGQTPCEKTFPIGPDGFETHIYCKHIYLSNKFKLRRHFETLACAATPEQSIRNAVRRWNEEAPKRKWEKGWYWL